LKYIKIRLEVEGLKSGQSTYFTDDNAPASNTVLCKPLLPLPLDEYEVYYSKFTRTVKDF